MGLRMDDIHAPTVPSGPSSTAPPTFDHTKEQPLMELIDMKTRVEEELSALGSVLDSHNVTMTTALTSIEGYPRSDIDVPQIRTTRARIIHLKNDHKALMAQIEKGLHARHAEYQAAHPIPPPPSTTRAATASQRPQNLTDTPFAQVNSVAPNSPAAEAGLEAGDKVRRVGEVNWLNHEKLSKVAEVVQGSVGRRVPIRVSRPHGGGRDGGEELELGLTPRNGWGGRGVLGCHLLPL